MAASRLLCCGGHSGFWQRVVMSWRHRLYAMTLLLLLAHLANATPAVGQGEFPDVCADNGNNLVQNCQFNDKMNSWGTFVEAGSPTFGVEYEFPACDSPKCPALRVGANDWFIGGIYQQISNVVPGATYWANVIWMVFHPAGAIDGTVGRRIGIDPTGGADPKSPAVVWSQEVWNKLVSCPYKICRELQVQTVARNTTITVFVRIEDTWKNRRDEFSFVPAEFFGAGESFWIDDVGLVPVGDVPAAPQPTPTPAPPADAPAPPTDVPAPPTDTPLPPATTQAPATEIPLPETDTPVAEVAQAPAATASPKLPPLPTITPTSEPTFEPTPTPRPATPTRTPRPTATFTPAPLIAIGPLGLLGGGALCLGGLAVIVIVAVGGGLLYWLYRLGTTDAEPGTVGPAGDGEEVARTRQHLTDETPDVGQTGTSSAAEQAGEGEEMDEHE